ncbi:hypothetical protein ASZ90_016376 [hydrocarbon metagenome]|uniref:Uncharacterized protein n=1 Tax=hydrocarbon metagenome TaxID=938273 RepID=A0A0W8EXU6_9ZZZZ
MDYYKSGLIPKFWINEMKQQYKLKYENLLKNRENISRT